MKKKLFIFGIIILICTSLFACSSPDELIDNPVDVENKIENNLTKLLDSVLTETQVPGLVAGIWAPDKQINFVYAAGAANLDNHSPMDENMLFRIGSITKTFTVTVLLQLADEGLIDLNDPLSKYLPDFPRGEEVTLEMLATMRSGIYNYSESEEFSINMREDPEHFYLPEDLIAIAADKPYYFEPGNEYYYSNTNAIIISKIIEMVTGNSLEKEIDSRIIKPLDLKNTYYMTSGREISGFHPSAYYAGKYDPDFLECSEWLDCSWAGAAGCMISDLFDLKKYVKALVQGTFLNNELQNYRLKTLEVSRSNIRYGLGILSYNDFYGHNGAYPGFSSIMMYSSQKNCTIIICYNCHLQDSTPFMLLPEVISIIYSDA